MTTSEFEASPKVLATHRYRSAVVYVRQSTPGQVEHNTESTDRQYALRERAVRLGWPRDAVRIIDADLGRSGASTAGRSGFAELTALVGLGQVGIVLALEVSRLARNNSDWYRLLDLAGMTNTLLADADGVYHPGLFNDRMLLGLKGTMSEAELHVLRARLDGGIRNKAKRGELRRALPVGLLWGEDEGQILLHPDEAVTGVIAAVFARFAACGSVRGTWLWLREQHLKWPLQPLAGAISPAPQVIWVEPTYHAVHTTLTHPAYAGAYVYGRTRGERYVTGDGDLRTRRRRMGRDDWEVCIPDHHQGFLDWDGYLANQQRIGRNIRPVAHQPGTGAVREGCALLQGLASCGTCGRKLAVYYDGRRRNTPGYYCTGTGHLIDGKNLRHLRIGGVGIDAAVGQAFLAAMAGDAVTACLAAARELQDGHHSVLEQHRREVQRARYDATRAERRYLAVDAENRLVARGLETAWEKALTALAAAEAELARREAQQPKTLTAEQHTRILALGTDLDVIWSAPTTTDRDRKELLGTLLTEVTISLDRPAGHADLVLRWKGGALTDLRVPLTARTSARLRTDEDTIDLVRRLAVHYPDAQIAGILNRQNRSTATGLPFTAGRVQTLRHHWNIPRHQPDAHTSANSDQLFTIVDAAAELKLPPPTLHRWITEGFITGEQLTPGAPWRIRLTDQVRALFVDEAPDGWLAMLEATLAHGLSRKTIMKNIKTGDLQAVYVRTGRRKGLRIEPPAPEQTLFQP
jgi:DNA invertase Pin-like site-specific DNA recombinase